MKKFYVLFLFLILSIFSAPVFADINPLSTKSIKYYGVGVLNLPKSFTVYSYPNVESEVIKEFNYEKLKKSAIINTVDMRRNSYVAYVPSSGIALVTVDMNPENGWYKIYINQETGQTGWVYLSDKNAFMTYRSLFYTYGKKYGLRLFGDLPDCDKVLYSQESETSKILERLHYPEYITFTVIRGNWMLATVREPNRAPVVGWFNWRNDDGTLKIFPEFKERRR